MIALLDANVLYPPALRDLLMWLAVVLAYEPRWTEEIHSEWMRNVLKDRQEVTPAQLEAYAPTDGSGKPEVSGERVRDAHCRPHAAGRK